MELKGTEVVTPAPYFKIRFGCGNRAFYTVQQELEEIALKLEIDYDSGVMSESCDFEGDLDTIEIYRGHCDCEVFVRAILEHYKIDPNEVPDGMNIVLSIF